MYKQEEFEALDNKATWVEVTRDKYFQLSNLAKREDVDMTNLYVRESIDPEKTEWTGILRFQTGTDIPWLKFTKRPDGTNKYFANSEVMNV